MNRWKQAGLIVLLTPLYLLALIVVHENGHTLLARLFGDPNATFYLVQIRPGGKGLCLGCNVFDHSKLSRFGNLAVSLGGLLFTQVTALIALGLMRYAPSHAFGNRLLAAIALGFAFLDVPGQVLQGLLYDIGHHTWPTNVDLMDAMMLISDWTGASQVVLKTILAILSVGYLYFVWWSSTKRTTYHWRKR